MYAVFDSFIAVGTWYTQHFCDEQRFYDALYMVAWDDKFDPDSMANYMRAKLSLDHDDRESVFAEAIQHYQAQAWAIKDFLDYKQIRKE